MIGNFHLCSEKLRLSIIECALVCVYVRICHINADIIFSYTMAGDICMLKVYFSSCDHPRLNPIRVIIDEVTACNGQLPN